MFQNCKQEHQCCIWAAIITRKIVSLSYTGADPSPMFCFDSAPEQIGLIELHKYIYYTSSKQGIFHLQSAQHMQNVSNFHPFQDLSVFSENGQQNYGLHDSKVCNFTFPDHTLTLDREVSVKYSVLLLQMQSLFFLGTLRGTCHHHGGKTLGNSFLSFRPSPLRL